MKKLLMLGAILVLGTTAFGVVAPSNESTADVTVKAELVAENLIISDLSGKDIVLDFKKISTVPTTGTKVAVVDYMVKYVGGGTLNGSNNGLAMTLGASTKTGAETVTLKHGNTLDVVTNDSFDVKVALNEYTGKMPADTKQYTGKITGTFDYASHNPILAGKKSTLSQLPLGGYIGVVPLNVTINGGNAITQP